jgi:hypothetical protein
MGSLFRNARVVDDPGFQERIFRFAGLQGSRVIAVAGPIDDR